ncbi:MAG TPA: DUF1329 domain-containing protein [Candidatus Binataceae bacterium]|nr:DUF1329 domain-containing protein [Candidatus Binataceae bacterium]
MSCTRRLSTLCLTLAAIALAAMPRVAAAAEDEMQSYLAATATQGTIPPGTRITMDNWRKYKEFMPPGMVAMFEGKYFWKMPSDVVMEIGPTVDHPLPPSYREATEKYSGQVRIVTLPNGGMNIENYVAGMPFPNPQEPHKGWKILVDEWFPPGAHLYVQSPETGLVSFCTQDRFGNRACVRSTLIYRALAFNTDPGVPRVEPGAGGAYYSEYIMVDEPEESKYTADLTLFWQDFTRQEDNYVFVPALRRTMRLSVSARCAPLLGSDMTHDDQKTGFNGGFVNFQANWLGDRKILGQMELTTADGKFPENYDLPLGWAKPSWGKWSLRDAYIIDVRRIPALSAGYCYGKRVMFLDKQTIAPLWIELYDSNMQPWKFAHLAKGPLTDPASGQTYAWGRYIEQYWDVQNDHASHIFGADAKGRDTVINGAVPEQYKDITRYSTPGGLMHIMQ